MSRGRIDAHAAGARTASRPHLRLARTRRGARLLHDGHLVSEILREPGPTHSLFDVLAACALALATGPRLALLGFGGGSFLAALRAMGGDHDVRAVDRSRAAWQAFRRVAGRWDGRLTVAIDDAARWLARQRQPFDFIVEDLSLPVPGDLVMPPVCFDPLPRLIAKRLQPRGVAVINVFTPPRAGWDGHLRRLLVPGQRAQVVHLADFDHRLLLLGRHLPPARSSARAVRDALASIGSRQSARFRLRTLV